MNQTSSAHETKPAPNRFLPAKVYHLNILAGKKELWRQLMSPDLSGVTGISSIFVASDGRGYVYEYGRTLSSTYTWISDV